MSTYVPLPWWCYLNTSRKSVASLCDLDMTLTLETSTSQRL